MAERQDLYRRNGEDGLEDLLHYLGLSAAGTAQPPSDLIFVALVLNLEGEITRTSTKIYEVGVSILDTRRFTSNQNRPIETEHFYVAGGNKQYMKSARKFLYGRTQRIDTTDLVGLLLSFFYWRDCSDPAVKITPSTYLHHKELGTSQDRKFRKVVLVCHAAYSELSHFKRLGIDVAAIPPLIAILDTLKISRLVLGRGSRLKDLLETLGCPTNNVHTAGNDTNYTLRALFLLALEGRKGIMNYTKDQFKILAFLKQVSREALPDITERHLEEKKLKQQDWGNQDWADSMDMLSIGESILF